MSHLTWTFITLMTRRLTRPLRPPRTRPHTVEEIVAVEANELHARTHPDAAGCRPPGSPRHCVDTASMRKRARKL
ncbi:hypothetical protein GCM10018785_42250 [Streptomyces longispororuber]|uniref:Uncharacterized protein n=1 Tax=Streptomyces longispororuber TaxID=68230 RepID=A0A918ZUU7_9ACTN|nr:hypothetical protein GCM10018785_42250 [Streptomyces longispororuber]